MKRFRPARNRPAEFIVRVYSRYGAAIQGRVEHVQSGQARQFRSLLELLHLIQLKLDETGHPQPATEIRCWDDGFPPFSLGGG